MAATTTAGHGPMVTRCAVAKRPRTISATVCGPVQYPGSTNGDQDPLTTGKAGSRSDGWV